MVCTKCGATLDDDVNFCPKCGIKVQTSGVSERKILGKKTLRASGVPECSEKNQLMVYVPGRGLYFIANGTKLCFLDEETDSIKVLTKKNIPVNLCGLGYYDGDIYYWMECQKSTSDLYGMRLNRLNVETNVSEPVWESDEDLFYHYRLDDTPLKARAILYQGAYYLLNHYEQKIMRVELPTGEWENLPLPNIQRHLPLYEWIKPKGVVDVKRMEPNFGMTFTGLNIVNGYIYLSLEEMMVCTLRFPVYNPDKVTYLPVNAAVAIQNDRNGGMLTSLGNRVFSCPGVVFGNAALGLYEIKEEGNLIRMISSSGDINLQYKGGLWWRLGNTYYIGYLAVDLYQRKFHKIYPLLFDQGVYKDNVFGEVVDFVPARNGSVYLLTEIGLYLVPADWEDQIKHCGEQERFRIANVKKL